MADKLTPERRSANMAQIRSKDTKPELLVRRIVHGLGYRFRLHRRDLPGRPDLVFPARRAVIFVHGCFWHQHPDPSCRDSKLPRSRTDYWHAKLARNVERDASAQASLISAGWRVLVLWECEVKADQALKDRLRSFLDHNDIDTR
jgi:DNA mismatch endonuclease, patch repair protein